jgi:hypothetical protein
MSIDVVFEMFMNGMWELYVDTSFKLNRKNQKDNEQEMQIEKNCVTTIKRPKLL